jgi:hypothetical protein
VYVPAFNVEESNLPLLYQEALGRTSDETTAGGRGVESVSISFAKKQGQKGAGKGDGLFNSMHEVAWLGDELNATATATGSVPVAVPVEHSVYAFH